MNMNNDKSALNLQATSVFRGLKFQTFLYIPKAVLEAFKTGARKDLNPHIVFRLRHQIRSNFSHSFSPLDTKFCAASWNYGYLVLLRNDLDRKTKDIFLVRFRAPGLSERCLKLKV